MATNVSSTCVRMADRNSAQLERDIMCEYGVSTVGGSLHFLVNTSAPTRLSDREWEAVVRVGGNRRDGEEPNLLEASALGLTSASI